MFGTALAIYMYAKQPECIKWTWSGDVYKRTVVCLEWRKPDKETDKKK